MISGIFAKYVILKIQIIIVMKNLYALIIAFSLLLAAPYKNFAQYSADDIQQYIAQYKDLAIQQMYEYKIPASITLAQGIFESACGTSRLAREGNNHFGIKCHKEWTGDTLLLDDDELQECFRKYLSVNESYEDHSLFLAKRPRYNALFSLDIMDYEGWAKGLKAAGYATNPQYADRLINLIKTYRIAQWDTLYQARLAQGYFNNPQPAVVENTPKPVVTPIVSQPATTSKPDKKHPAKHKKPAQSTHSGTPAHHNQTTPAKANSGNPEGNVKKPHQTSTAGETVILPTPEPMPQTTEVVYTETAQENLPTSITVFQATADDFPLYSEKYPFTDRPVYINNRTLFVLAQRGDTYATIAKDVQDKEKRIKKYNNVTGNTRLKTGQVVYIERKSKTGEKDYYTVKNMETLQYISQATAVDLQRICQYNHIDVKKTLKKGDIIKLKR